MKLAELLPFSQHVRRGQLRAPGTSRRGTVISRRILALWKGRGLARRRFSAARGITIVKMIFDHFRKDRFGNGTNNSICKLSLFEQKEAWNATKAWKGAGAQRLSSLRAVV